MGGWFIAVVLVMIVMNAFLFLALTSITARVNHQVNSFFSHKLDICNNLMEQRLAQLEELRNQVEEQKQKKAELEKTEVPEEHAPQPAAVYSSTPTTYVNKHFREQYCLVRQGAHMDKAEVVRQILTQHGQTEDIPGLKQKKAILDRFSYDSRYLLMTLGSQEQLRILEEELNDEEQQILRAYCEQNPEFSSDAFFQQLQNECSQYSDTCVIKVAPNVTVNLPDHPEVVQQNDEEICEGIKVLYRGQLYDYSL